MLDFILYLLIGALAGYLAGKIMKGRSFGLLFNLIIGIVGGVVGGFIFRLFGLHTTNIIGSLVTATAGAVVLLWLVTYLKKK